MFFVVSTFSSLSFDRLTSTEAYVKNIKAKIYMEHGAASYETTTDYGIRPMYHAQLCIN